MSSPRDPQFTRLVRRAEHVVREEELAEKLSSGKPLRVKLGLDPTARHVTLGWAVPLRKLREFQDEGHTVVLIIGDFTARIGDPTGKNETRPQLTKDEVGANAEACVAQLMDILSTDNLEVRYNSEWLEPMDLGDLLALTAKYTVAQMLERDDFSKRFKDHRPISLIEFMYPLLQGYDSVAVKADVELGGTDQLFNLLVARDLQRAYGQTPQVALTMPLLEGLDGVQKMSQSLGNYVGVREAPEEMFGKLMSIPDNMVTRYAFLASDLDDAAIAQLEVKVSGGGPDAGEAKRSVAKAIISIYHGALAATEAEASFDRQFRQGAVPIEIPEHDVPADALSDGRLALPAAMVTLGLAASKGEARRLIKGAGVKLGGETVHSEEIEAGDLAGKVLQVGKRRFVRFKGGEGAKG